MFMMMIVTIYQVFFVYVPNAMLNIVVKFSKQGFEVNIIIILYIKKGPRSFLLI